MKVEIVDRGDFVVVGMKYRGRNEHGEIPALWGQFMPHVGEIREPVDLSIYYGVMGNYDMATGEFDYVAGTEVDPGAATPEGMARWELAAQTYAVFTFPFGHLMEAIDYANRTWLPESGRVHVDAPEFEYYPSSFEPDDPNSEMQLWIPVK